MAEERFNAGRALFQEGRYNEALIELHRAEDAFRKQDAPGHPFAVNLSNGVSGLANTLFLSGQCCQKLGDHKAALTYYETSLINAKFEKKRAFRAFMRQLSENMIFCYERTVEESGAGKRDLLLSTAPEIDVSFRFPYSLQPDLIPFARLYELAPERYPRYKDYFQRAKEKDAEYRRLSKTSDESTMRKMSIYVWGIIVVIWTIYGLIVVKTLLQTD